MAARDDVIANF